MKKLLIGSLFCVLSSTAMAENLSQVMPGTWDGKATMKIDPRNTENTQSPTELRLTRNTGSTLEAYDMSCESAEFSQFSAPLMQDAYDRQVMVEATMKMRVAFAANGNTSALTNVEYSVAGNPLVARCSTKSNDQTMINDERSELIDVATGTKTQVQILSHDEIIVK